MGVAKWYSCAKLALFTAVLAQSVAPSYRLSTVAGTDSVGDGGRATMAVFRQTEGCAADGIGNLYVADAADHRVRRIGANGIVQTVAGTGVPGFSGDGGPGTAAQLTTPYGLALGANGDLYIADLGNARVRKLSLDGTITTVAGGGDQPARTTLATSKATDLALKSPRNVAVDGATLLIADFEGQTVYRLQTNGYLKAVAGTGVAGFSGDGDSAEKAQLNFPSGLAVDSAGNVLISDALNRRVRRVVGGMISTLSQPTWTLSLPTGLAVDRTGALVLADSKAGVTLRVTSAGQVTKFPFTARDVCADPYGNFSVTTGGQVKRMGANGSLTPFAGTDPLQAAGDGGPAAQARLRGPAALVQDDAGNVYFAESEGHRVRRIDPFGSVSTIAGTGEKGNSGDGGLGTSAKLNGPAGLALDRAGNLYIADTQNHLIRRLNRAGMLTAFAGTGVPGGGGDGGPARLAQLREPAALAFDRDGGLLIADSGNHVLRRIMPDGSIFTVAGVQGQPGYSGDGGPAVLSRLTKPRGIAVGPDGAWYVADTGNDALRRIGTDGRIATLADAIPSYWSGLTGVAVAPNGDVWVADTGHHQLAALGTDGRVRVVAGTGAAGLEDGNPDAASSPLNGPAAVLLEPAGTVLIADRDNNRLRRLTVVPVAVDSQFQDDVRVLHAATLQPGPVAPGQLVLVIASGIGPANSATVPMPFPPLLPTLLNDVQVFFDGLPAPLLAVRSDQLQVQVPYGLAGRIGAQLSVLVKQEVRARTNVTIADSAPGAYATAGGTGWLAAWQVDGTKITPEQPASAGAIITFYLTGEGQTRPGGRDGVPANSPLPQPQRPVAVTIGGQSAEILYAGAAPGLVGVLQCNVRVPLESAGAAPVVITIGGTPTQANLLLPVSAASPVLSQ